MTTRTAGRRRSREGNTRHLPISAEDGEQAWTYAAEHMPPDNERSVKHHGEQGNDKP